MGLSSTNMPVGYKVSLQWKICLNDRYRSLVQVASRADESTYDGRWKYLRRLMKVFTIVSAAIFILLCPIIRLAVCREQLMGEPGIANWQNANSRLAPEWLVGCFTGTVIENSFTEFSQVFATRPERAEAPSPGRALKKSLHGLC